MCFLLVKLSTEIFISSIFSFGLFSIFLSLLRFFFFHILNWLSYFTQPFVCMCVWFFSWNNLCSFSHLSSLQRFVLLFLIVSLCVHTLVKGGPPKPEGSNHPGAKVICCEPPEMRVLEIKLRSSGKKRYMLLITEPSIQPPSSDFCYFCLVICIS